MSETPADPSPLERFTRMVNGDPELVALAAEISEKDSERLAAELFAYWDDDIDPALFTEPEFSIRSDGEDVQPTTGLNAVLERAGWVFRSSPAFPPLVHLGSEPVVVEFDVEPETQSVCGLGPILGASYDVERGKLVLDPISIPDGYELRLQLGMTGSVTLGVDVVDGERIAFDGIFELPKRLVLSWRALRVPPGP